jgi:hypothetical protein
MKALQLFLLVASATIFSCDHFRNHLKDGREAVANADKIIYSFHASSVAPKYHRSYSIAVTENNLHLSINSYSDTLFTKDWPFTAAKFDEVKEKLKGLKEDGEIDESEIADGGTSDGIALYKEGKEIFSGTDHKSTKNFSGADVNLSYLIPDLKELIESTKKEDAGQGFMDTPDKIEYSHKGPTVAPQYNRGYTITITSEELAVVIKSYSDVLLTKKRDFTKEKFDEVVRSFKNFKEGSAPKDIPVGGSSEAIAFFKEGKIILKGYSYGGNAKNFSGADIDLSYLVPDLKELIESTKTEH